MDTNSPSLKLVETEKSESLDLPKIPRLGPGTKVLKPYPLTEVAIVGMGPTGIYWLQRAYTDMGTLPEVWTINSGCRAIRSSLNFSMHTKATMQGMEPEEVVKIGQLLTRDNLMDQKQVQLRQDFNRKLQENLSETDTPQVTLDGADDSFEFPFAEAVEEFQTAYLQNGIAYMMAFALMCFKLAPKDVQKKISIYGADFDFRTPGSMYEAGRCCVEYWMGRAHERQVGIVLPDKSNLMDMMKVGKTGMYGFGFEQPKFNVKDGKVFVDGFHPLPTKEQLANANAG